MASLEDKSIWEDGQVNSVKPCISFRKLQNGFYLSERMHL